jgi:hypothetical protein
MNDPPDAPQRSSASPPVKPVAVFDVDGVVSPVHGHTAWGDDVVAGNVFGPAYTSTGSPPGPTTQPPQAGRPSRVRSIRGLSGPVTGPPGYP